MTLRASLTCALLLIIPLTARGDSSSDAKHHFERGVALARQHDFPSAITEFETSYRLNPVPEVLFNIALSQKALGKPLEAIANIQRYLADARTRPAGLATDSRDEAVAVVVELEAQLVTLQLDAPAGVELRVDGKLVGRAPVAAMKLDPGTHQVDATASGYAPEHAESSLSPGQTQTLAIQLSPVAPPSESLTRATPPVPSGGAVAATATTSVRAVPIPDSESPRFLSTTRGRFAIGAGIATLGLFGAGTITGMVVLDDRSNYRASCTHVCDDGLYARAHSLANATDVVMAIGGVAAITTAVLYFTRPNRSHVSALPMGSTGSLGIALQGEF